MQSEWMRSLAALNLSSQTSDSRNITQGFASLISEKQFPCRPDQARTTFLFPSFQGFQPASTNPPTACFAKIQPELAFFARLLREQKPCWPGKECLHPFRRTTRQDAPTPWSSLVLLSAKGFETLQRLWSELGGESSGALGHLSRHIDTQQDVSRHLSAPILHGRQPTPAPRRHMSCKN